jgi:alpha-1,2-mannosyltransferase
MIGVGMSRRIGAILFVLLLAGLAAAWVRSAWMVPLRNYPFDFSINYTGSRLLSVRGSDGPLYNRIALATEAAPYTAYPVLYTKLYLTYIQTPLTAVLSVPVSRMPLDDAQLVFLSLSNLLLVAAAAVMVIELRPSRLLVAAAFFIFATYEAMFDSLRLGQVDAIIVFCLALAFVLLRHGRHPLMGAPLALAAALKLSPVVVIGYFAWRRAWRVVGVAAASIVLLTVVSVLVAGWDNNVTFVRDTMPRLMKGSTFYDNVSLGGAAARAHFGRWSWYYEDEVPEWPAALRLGMLALNAAVVLGAYLVAGRDEETGFMLSVAVAILISPVSWSFYPTWLIPSLLWLVRRYEDRRAWRSLAVLALLYPLLAIVPAHFQSVSRDLYALPIKTAALAAYAMLLALESRTVADQRVAGKAAQSGTLIEAGVRR